MDEIVSDAVSAKRVIAPGINRAHVAGLQGDMVNLVEFDEMIVPGEQNGTVRMILNEVMRRPHPDSAQKHSRNVALGPSPLASKVAVLHKVTCGPEGLPVSPAERNTAVPGVKNIATQHSV